MAPGAWLLVTIFGLAALQSAVELVHKPSSASETVFSTPEADTTHLVMNGVMAAMVTPFYSAAVRSVAFGLLAFTALGVALALVRHRPGAASPGPLSFRAYAVAAAYHVLMLAAMIYALAVMTPSMGPMCSTRTGAMGPMAATANRWLTLPHMLGTLFGLDAVTGLLAVLALPHQLLAAEIGRTNPLTFSALRRAGAARREVRRLRVGFIPHWVMDVGMMWMLFAS